MSWLERLLRRRAMAATAELEVVVGFAQEQLRRRAKDAQVVRVGASQLEVKLESGVWPWNLSALAQRAQKDPRWRRQVEAEAGRLVARAKGRERPPSTDVDAAVLVVWPQERLAQVPPRQRLEEPLVPGLALVYAVRREGKVRPLSPVELAASGLTREQLRARALRNLAPALERLSLRPLAPKAQVLTNHRAEPLAASLLANTGFWRRLEQDAGPVLVALPSPTRLFIAPRAQGGEELLWPLLHTAFETEKELLSGRLLEFSQGRWEALGMH